MKPTERDDLREEARLVIAGRSRSYVGAALRLAPAYLEALEEIDKLTGAPGAPKEDA